MSLFRKKTQERPTTKRLTSNKKKRKGIFKRRKKSKNPFPQTPDGMNDINILSIDSGKHYMNDEWIINKEFATKYKYICDIKTHGIHKMVKVKRLIIIKTVGLLVNGFIRNLSSSNKNKIIIPLDIIKLILFWYRMVNVDQGTVDQIYAIKLVSNIFSPPYAKAKGFLLRELRILQTLSQSNVITQLIDIIPPSNPLKFTKLSVVFEYMPTNLKTMFCSEQYWSHLQIKYILYQILLAIKCIHNAGIVHRNIKPENILINEQCNIKVCNVSVARGITEPLQGKHCYTEGFYSRFSKVLSMTKDEMRKAKMKLRRVNATTYSRIDSYQSPEEILSVKTWLTLYSIDVWSVGCVFGELLQMHHKNYPDYKTRRVLFRANKCYPFPNEDPLDLIDSEYRRDQLRIAFELIGTPKPQEIEKFKDLDVQVYLNSLAGMITCKSKDLCKMYSGTEKSGIELLKQMLMFDANKRITVKNALKSSYFDDIRDEYAESKCETMEKFEFEDIGMREIELRALILDEIMYFNPQWKKQLKQRYKAKAKELKRVHNANK